MTTLALAAVMQVSLLTMGTETYAEAYRATEETGRPLVVMIGADWCAACQVMERTVLPQIRERGILGKVGFALVNLDRERELSDQLTNRGPIPQLLLFRKVEDGWKLRRLIGSHSVEAVEQFINQGVQADQTHNKAKLDAEEDTPPVKARLASQGAVGGDARQAIHPIGR
ncbi:MAG: thioredoxin family protein [Thermoguttaceae bacterium]